MTLIFVESDTWCHYDVINIKILTLDLDLKNALYVLHEDTRISEISITFC